MDGNEAVLIVQVAEAVAPDIIAGIKSIIANHKDKGLTDDQLAATAINEFNATAAAAAADIAADKTQ